MEHLGRMSADGRRVGEDPADGCPGAWYRCGWALSVAHYQRPQTGGVYSEGLRLRGVTDGLLLEAVAYYEQECARSYARIQEAWNDYAQARSD